nr:penicillin-binding protein 1C [Bacteroidia bacterium]
MKKKFFLFVISLIVFFFILHFLFPLRYTKDYCQVITDKDKNILHAFLTDDDKWRMQSEFSEINPVLIKTILYKEDKYFYYHPGVNIFAVIRAVVNNLMNGRTTSGASTITMQVARLLYPAKRNYLNKGIEMFRALQLEITFTKDEILMLYLNLVPYGGNIEGVKAASFFYFNTKPQNLNLSQSVILSIIPNRPNSLSPKKGTALIRKERDKWLHRMITDEFTSIKQITEAIAEPVDMPRHPTPKLIPHLALRLRNNSSNRTSICTTIDKKMQEKSESIAYNYSKRMALKNIFNLSVIVVENSNRAVRTYIGSPDFYDTNHSGQVDGCNAVRSPGSTLKPLVYAMGIDKGLITPAYIVQDVPVNYDGYSPENFNSQCNGMVPVSKALAYSLNIPAVDLLNKTGLSDFTATLRKTGFQSIRNDREMGLSLILGGCGVRAIELAGLYSTIANGGEYMPLKYDTQDTAHQATKIISEAASFMVTEMLTGLVRPDLPNNSASSMHIPKIAWKTGTSYGRRDAWSVGFNKKYTIVVWIGNFSGEGVPELTGADMATPLLFELFNTLDYNSTSNWYVAPKSADLRLVCSHSGLPPGENCTDLITDYFIPGISDYKRCTHLREVIVSADEKFSYCMSCIPDAGYKKVHVPNLPPSVTSFYSANGIDFQKAPPHNPECTKLFTENAPAITSPVNKKEYLLEKNADQQLKLTCISESDITWIYWYINDTFLTKVKPGEPAFFTPGEGEQKISCSDDKGRN